MKYRYKVLEQAGHWDGWQVLDSHTGKIFNFYKTRREARERCQRMNAADVLSREDQQQYRGETI